MELPWSIIVRFFVLWWKGMYSRHYCLVGLCLTCPKHSWDHVMVRLFWNQSSPTCRENEACWSILWFLNCKAWNWFLISFILSLLLPKLPHVLINCSLPAACMLVCCSYLMPYSFDLPFCTLLTSIYVMICFTVVTMAEKSIWRCCRNHPGLQPSWSKPALVAKKQI